MLSHIVVDLMNPRESPMIALPTLFGLDCSGYALYSSPSLLPDDTRITSSRCRDRSEFLDLRPPFLAHREPGTCTGGNVPYDLREEHHVTTAPVALLNIKCGTTVWASRFPRDAHQDRHEIV